MITTYCFKASETLLGIETIRAILNYYRDLRFKASETLLGIETQALDHVHRLEAASKPLKPF